MSTKKTNPAISHCTNILKFWHKVEFFIPFDLQRQVLEAKDAESSVRTFSGPQLHAADVRILWQVDPSAGRKLSGFEVFLGIFDKVELTEVTQGVVQEALTPDEVYDQEQRGELEGWTCFARIKVSAQGEPKLEEISVSTAPWALGCILQRGLTGLDFGTFQDDIERLKESLKNFRAGRASKEASTVSTTDHVGDGASSAPTQPLTAAELSVLLDIFYDWAGYRPQDGKPNAPVLVIRTKSVDDKATWAAKNAKDPSSKEDAVDTEDEGDEAVSAEDSEIDILNSFYAQDIARAIASLQRGDACSVLEAYLTPVADAQRIDLYQSAGKQRIADGLQPDRLNTGHWLDRPCHAMSLMQQFAINSVFEQLKTSGVFSVNGPPGTGKTTLLRDIFAENIVQRARALAKYDSPGEAFLPGSVTVNFKGVVKSCTLALLREEISGFEMVVASSNNAAVENISHDLPKTKSLAKPGSHKEKAWRDAQGKATVGYLQPVAHNVAARNGKGEYEKLATDDEPWGLISCALGKKSNRTAFADRLGSAGAKPWETKPPKGFDSKLHQSLWTWRDQYKGINYAEARRIFLEVDLAIKELIKQLDDYAKLYAEMQGHTPASYTAAAAHDERQAQHALSAAQAAFKVTGNEWQLCDSQLKSLQSEERLTKERIPGWWARQLKRPAYLDYCEALDANHRRQCEWLRRKIQIEEPRLAAENAVKRVTTVHIKAKQALLDRQAGYQSKQAKLELLAKKFPQAACPEQLDDLEQEHWQINGLYWDEALNEKRAELFAAALQLHEAWLAEVLQKGGRFGGNVVAFCNMLSGKCLQESEHALAIWRSLFMVVPVVSSTFASFASQFRDLGANALGWLFIDEAGQAVPQAAVGALWRAKRAVVVGDPLQIEPVFTVPIKLIEALAKSSDLPLDRDVAPHRVSVQNLADAANCLGAWISSDDDAQWIGSPLRVHRRCVDPMFSIANEIAYKGKMIFFDPKDPQKRLPPMDSLDLGGSAWVHALGEADSKQSVSAQIELVHQALMLLYQRTGSLPPIYIISPFKRIKDELISRISKLENWGTLTAPGGVDLPKKSKLQEWCKARIGTVHTFQGKEESVVWMVLGCDNRLQGAANWAADKPNLLNVALTRAKHRFFMIGDVGLWGGLRHFVTARTEVLPRISPSEFLLRMGQPSSVTVGVEPIENVFSSNC